MCFGDGYGEYGDTNWASQKSESCALSMRIFRCVELSDVKILFLSTE